MMLAMVAALALAAPAEAEPPATDSHVRFVRYRENGLIAFVGHLGFQTTIPFAEGERIENVAIGDATGWQVTPNKRADILFVKPITRSKPTNMIVVTNQRTYNFSLSVAPPRASTANATWVLRFQLPAPPPPPVVIVRQPVAAAHRNADYTIAGTEALFPSQVFDDGVATYFAWPEQIAMPAIFAVNPDGSEAVVNFVMRDGLAMVEQTAGRFVLRQGASAATVTSTPGFQRRQPKPAGH